MNPPIAILILAAGMAAIPLHAGNITDLGTLTGGANSNGYAVSADGAVGVGTSDTASGARAFRWTTAGGMVSLGTLPGGSTSDARGVSADGSVVVGLGTSAAGTTAFRWTQAGGMTSLGVLPGATYSEAYGVSADGSVVVGISNPSGGRAFVWTQSGGMTNIGSLYGTFSCAYAVSANGLVVVGDSDARAFRWTQAAGMADLGTLGGAHAVAKGVSADGSVVVGYSELAGPGMRAFRWTQATGMVSLGTLAGGNDSNGLAVSADGSVVVGTSNSATGTFAFRWTQADGMTSLGTLPGGTSSNGFGVSADGNVIIGTSSTPTGAHAFLYANRVMLDVDDWLASVGGVHSLLSTSLELTRLHIDGAHHRPLAELGRIRSFWTTGDIADSSRSRDLITRSGEAGATFVPAENMLMGVGAGYGMQDQSLANDGSARTFGQYLVGEVDFIQADGGIFSILASFGDWRTNSTRGYVTGSGVDYSSGETTLSSRAIRVRYDSPVIARFYATDLKAYASYANIKVRSAAYDETGGSYAGSFGAMRQTAKEGRLGLAATHGFSEKTKARLSAEWIRRFDHDHAALTATDITSTLDLSLPTVDPVRDQFRVGVDIDYAFDTLTTLSFTVHAAGVGESPDVASAISIRRAF